MSKTFCCHIHEGVSIIDFDTDTLTSSTVFLTCLTLHQENDFAIIHWSHLPCSSRSSGIVELTSSVFLRLDVFAFSLIDLFLIPRCSEHYFCSLTLC